MPVEGVFVRDDGVGVVLRGAQALFEPRAEFPVLTGDGADAFR